MDTLSDLLRVVRLDGAFFYPVEAGIPWSVEAMPARELTRKILPGSEHLIPYHFLTAGNCWVGVVGEEPVEMLPGDVVLFPHGDAHVMSSGPGVRLPNDLAQTSADRYMSTQYLGPEGHRGTHFVCGFLGCDLRPFNPLLAALPRRMHMRGISHTGFGEYARQLAVEASSGVPGAESVLTRLAELMFISVVRRYLDDLPPGQTGWLAGLRDEVVGRVLGLIHGRPGHPWTLVDLAREGATSRTALAKRFTDLVGQPPMQYLTQWRMQVAASRLAEGNAKVATIAAEVGYESEAAFSRAFKKATGVSPGAWRESRRAPPK
ncbi:MAG TPA: AraC family transcriptional regulator [Gemmatimonadales bacterium]|nr:AraC family transcriptional regulator [Gemmatimonadales bacterium]